MRVEVVAPAVDDALVIPDDERLPCLEVYAGPVARPVNASVEVGDGHLLVHLLGGAATPVCAGLPVAHLDYHLAPDAGHPGARHHHLVVVGLIAEHLQPKPGAEVAGCGGGAPNLPTLVDGDTGHKAGAVVGAVCGARADWLERGVGDERVLEQEARQHAVEVETAHQYTLRRPLVSRPTPERRTALDAATDIPSRTGPSRTSMTVTTSVGALRAPICASSPCRVRAAAT